MIIYSTLLGKAVQAVFKKNTATDDNIHCNFHVNYVN